MPRKKRIVRPGLCYHVLLRGNGGQEIFKDQADRARFCILMQYASECHQIKIHGFCLMSNHVHLLIQPTTEDLSSGMHALAFRYAQHYNRKYKTRGYLYQGRFKAIIIQTGNYLMKLIRYIHLNPVRAGIVRSPDRYTWSSHLAYMEKATYTWLEKNLVLDSYGGSTENLRSYISKENDEANQELFEIRKSVRNGAYGDEEFLDSLSAQLSVEEAFAGPVLKCRLISLQNLIECVCSHLNISQHDLQSERRDGQLVQARAIVGILSKKLGIASFSEVGKKILRDPTSIAKLAKKMEKNPSIGSILNDISLKLAK